MKDKVKVKEIFESIDNFPVEGEAYVVGQAENGLYFFAWGPVYPHMPEKPILDDPFGRSGIKWYDRKSEAIYEYRVAVRHLQGEGKMKLKYFSVSADHRTVLDERSILDAERHILISFELIEGVHRFIEIDPQTGTVQISDVPQATGMDRDELKLIAPDGKLDITIPPGKWSETYPRRYLVPEVKR